MKLAQFSQSVAQGSTSSDPIRLAQISHGVKIQATAQTTLGEVDEHLNEINGALCGVLFGCEGVENQIVRLMIQVHERLRPLEELGVTHSVTERRTRQDGLDHVFNIMLQRRVEYFAELADQWRYQKKGKHWTEFSKMRMMLKGRLQKLPHHNIPDEAPFLDNVMEEEYLMMTNPPENTDGFAEDFVCVMEDVQHYLDDAMDTLQGIYQGVGFTRYAESMTMAHQLLKHAEADAPEDAENWLWRAYHRHWFIQGLFETLLYYRCEVLERLTFDALGGPRPNRVDAEDFRSMLKAADVYNTPPERRWRGEFLTDEQVINPSLLEWFQHLKDADEYVPRKAEDA